MHRGKINHCGWKILGAPVPRPTPLQERMTGTEEKDAKIETSKARNLLGCYSKLAARNERTYTLPFDVKIQESRVDELYLLHWGDNAASTAEDISVYNHSTHVQSFCWQKMKVSSSSCQNILHFRPTRQSWRHDKLSFLHGKKNKTPRIIPSLKRNF